MKTGGDKMTTGEKIRLIRKKKGLTQEDLGNMIGVQKAAINKYETGIVVNLKRDTIAKLAKALDVSPVWLMDDRPPDADDLVPQTEEARIVSHGIDHLPKEKREMVLNVVRAMFTDHADLFTKGTDEDDDA
jgi:transcriptional regulator with XRE-family HTH domain